MKFIAIVSSLAAVIGSEAFVPAGNTRQSFTGECPPPALAWVCGGAWLGVCVQKNR